MIKVLKYKCLWKNLVWKQLSERWSDVLIYNRKKITARLGELTQIKSYVLIKKTTFY